MLAVVDKKKQELALYSTLPVWFLYHQHLNECGVIALVPRTDANLPTMVSISPKIAELSRSLRVENDMRSIWATPLLSSVQKTSKILIS